MLKKILICLAVFLTTQAFSSSISGGGGAGGGGLGTDTAAIITATTAFRAANGSTGVPSYSFTNDTNTGLYLTTTADRLGIVSGGQQVGYFDTTGLSTGVVSPTTAMRAAGGSQTVPSWSFTTDPDTGCYNSAADAVRCVTGGVDRFQFHTTGATILNGGVMRAGVGAVGAPSYTIDGDGNTGWYTPAADNFSIVTGGTARATFDSTGAFNLVSATASRVPYFDASKNLVTSSVTNTELGYLSGVTSAIQTQIDTKAAASGYTALRALASDTTGAIAVSGVTATELGYVSGVTSAIQTQINAIKVEDISGHIESLDNKTYFLRLAASYAYTVNSITVDCASGTADGELQIDGTPVTGCEDSDIDFSSTEETETCSAANSVSAGNDLTLVVTNNSSGADCRFTVKTTRS